MERTYIFTYIHARENITPFWVSLVKTGKSWKERIRKGLGFQSLAYHAEYTHHIQQHGTGSLLRYSILFSRIQWDSWPEGPAFLLKPTASTLSCREVLWDMWITNDTSATSRSSNELNPYSIHVESFMRYTRFIKMKPQQMSVLCVAAVNSQPCWYGTSVEKVANVIS